MRRSATALRTAFALALAACGAQAFAAEYKSVGAEPAVLYDAPTQRGIRIFVAPRGMPVEVIVAQGDWLRVRDATGGLAWMEKKALVDKRTVVVTRTPAPAEVRAAGDDGAPVVFLAQYGVLLDLVSPPAFGWVQVRHRDGPAGFVKVGDVWGE
jgi:SH3-like domain-containing protein